MNSDRRVVITGMGQVSPFGNSIEELAEGLQEQRSAVGPVDAAFQEGLSVLFGGTAEKFTGHIGNFGDLEKAQLRSIRKNLKVMCREIQMGVAVAQLALQDAGLKPEECEATRSGVVFGCDHIMTIPSEISTGIIASRNENKEYEFSRWAEHGLPEVNPLWLLKYLPNMPASHVAIFNDFQGPNNSLTMREAGGNLAIAESAGYIARGSADLMLAGATGTCLHPVRSVHVCLQQPLAKHNDPTAASRPFDVDRNGVVLGEGAGVVCLENLDHAEKRNAKIWGEVVGSGSSIAASGGKPDITKALVNAIKVTFDSAGISPEEACGEIGHVHAHGVSHVDLDIAEARAIAEVFGTEKVPPVTAAKSYFGHLGAGGGVVELIGSLLSLDSGRLFKLLNCENLDPNCPIRPAVEGDSAGSSVLNLSVTPLGQASALLVKKFE
ncbi:MAG: beta-ketoacyl-[acyl-carrier-protein] synthase family protein [Pirellulaceae bacterium]|nr:beta-ketoacyl-[acyl-carrier-protein] synthase family protein [Pirellulaceae bacterium]